MVSFPPCKINLGLHVISKRPDGYHNLETCFYPVPWTDILEVIPSKTFAFSSSGNKIPGSPDQNLCVKAYELIVKEFSIDPIQMHLHKIIPMGAGLGGGSSDAAHVIRMLNEVFSLDMQQEKMMQLAALIGSDTAFFIQDSAMIGTGRGEILAKSNVNLAGKFLVLVNPDIHVSTAEAYAHIVPKQPQISLSEILGGGLEEWSHSLKNDFELSVFKKYPVIKDLKDRLYSQGAMYASMSGSGATVFGIFKGEFNAAAEFPNATVWSGWL